ncbi:SCO1431 family membrane protein [Streptomyces sp. t39]|uniref:SCO1431 family membrane protein n=1 Tax=Streptomyces sp. t39 TaxID=1828156 RepID=UPI0011CE1887|nr:SCO1431 family membrane protein [Streptomyces sp. t39]TXS51480.1 SCO1431 family membrane protein [Streptomyces sp. t39]
MTSTAATAAAARTGRRTRTGGPDGPAVLEHVLGWTLVVLLAVLITRLGLL